MNASDQLIGAEAKPPSYDSRSGQFRGANGRFVRRADILQLVDQESQRTEARLKAQTRLMIAGKLSLSEWEKQFAQTLKESHLRMMALSSGGKQNLTSRHYGAAGYELRRQYEFLDGFARDLAAGKLTADRALWRSGLYSSSIKTAFFKGEKIQKELESFTVARRSLDASANHCSSCTLHSTYGEWKPIAEVVEPGVNCECRSNCKCSIFYAKLADVVRAAA